MYTASNSESTAPRALPPALPTEAIEPGFIGCAPPEMSSDLTAAYDPTLLLAALEEIEVQRAAIEWLVDADLLCLCSV